MIKYKKETLLSDRKLKHEIYLDEICQSLQLDDTRRKRMESAYKSLSSLLESNVYFQEKDLLVYAYGSEALGTNTKPYKKEEFDLDFVSVVSDEIEKLSPENMLDNVWNVLYSDERYKYKIKRMRYCIRINYEGDFHIDIMPCLRIPMSKRLKAADTKIDQFVRRYPKGYIVWFHGLFILDTSKLSLSDYYKLKMELRAETEVLPQSVPYELMQPIQRSVQLIKRARDVYFETSPKLATSSIILTTLAGRHYKSELSITESISNIIDRISQLVQEHQYPYILEVFNPADDNLPIEKREKLSNKWNEGKKGKKRYHAFIEFINWFRFNWNQFLDERNSSEEILKEMFGKAPVNDAIINRGRVINSLNDSGLIGIDPRTQTLTTNQKSLGYIPLVRSTNHGEVF